MEVTKDSGTYSLPPPAQAYVIQKHLSFFWKERNVTH